MAERTPQSFANHAHSPTLSVVAFASVIVAFGLFVNLTIRQPGPLAYGLLSLTISVMALVAISRIYIIRLQDRIIRLEMLGRLTRLGRAADYGQLSTRQLVALRFASDAELPALCQRAMGEKLSSRQIKEAVREWQADYQRT